MFPLKGIFILEVNKIGTLYANTTTYFIIKSRINANCLRLGFFPPF